MPPIATRLFQVIPFLTLMVLATSGCFDPDLALDGQAADPDFHQQEVVADTGETPSTVKSVSRNHLEKADVPASRPASKTKGRPTPTSSEPTPTDEGTTTADEVAEEPTLTDDGSTTVDDATEEPTIADTAGTTDNDVSCTGVMIQPGSDVAALVESQASGTTFCFEAGTYNLTRTIIPRSGQRLVAVGDVILDGGGTVDDGVKGFGGHQDDVVVRGFEIRNFADHGVESGFGWRVNQNTIHDTDIGVRLKEGSAAVDNVLTRNRRYGLVARGDGSASSGGVTIEGNEISFNNTARYDEGDQGGTKLMKLNGLTVRRNWVHNNYGNGLWTDGDNINVLYENNVAEDNDGIGIFHEISYDATIRDNTVRNNGAAGEKSLWYGSQLHVQNSQNVSIYENMVEGPSHGIGIVGSSGRGEGMHGTYRAANIKVHDNTVAVAATSGAVGDITSSGITFTGNTYIVDDAEGHWVWGSSTPLAWRRWQEIGNDQDGVRVLD